MSVCFLWFSSVHWQSGSLSIIRISSATAWLLHFIITNTKSCPYAVTFHIFLPTNLNISNNRNFHCFFSKELCTKFSLLDFRCHTPSVWRFPTSTLMTWVGHAFMLLYVNLLFFLPFWTVDLYRHHSMLMITQPAGHRLACINMYLLCQLTMSTKQWWILLYPHLLSGGPAHADEDVQADILHLVVNWFCT